MKERASNFELLRIIAMMCIVMYHALIGHFSFTLNDNIYMALMFPLHIGVILFVLISGYFGIKTSPKGLLKIISYMLLYCLIIPLLAQILLGIGNFELSISSLMFISRTELWYMRTYLFLFLLAPIINLYLSRSDLFHRICIIVILGFIAIYVGSVGNDPSLKEGKNIANFMLLYAIGHCLNHEQKTINNIKTQTILSVYLFINLSVVLSYIFIPTLRPKLWTLFFYYCSPGLILNSILVLILISRIRFSSSKFNYWTSSALAIYLIHCSNIFNVYITTPFCNYLKQSTNNHVLTMVGIFALGILTCIFCLAIDKIFTPYWSIVSKLGKYTTNQYMQLKSKFNE